MSAIIEARHLTKRFGTFTANNDINLSVQEGEVRAIIGENGAGKTTLMNMLYGILQPTEGELLFKGQPVQFHSPKDAIEAGIGMVHQHFKLSPSLTVYENIVLGIETNKKLKIGNKEINLPLIDNKRERKVVEDLIQKYNFSLNPDDKIRDLSIGARQRVEILKMLYRQVKVLILDEPTAVLIPQEVEELIAKIHDLKRMGQTVIIITHKLNEVKACADTISVMRRGQLIDTIVNDDAATTEKLAEMMVGRPVLYDRLEKTGEAGAEQIAVHDLTVCDDRGLVAVDGLSLSVRAGEVLGIAAIEGNGQSELLEAITGMRRVERGTVEVCGQNVTGKTAGEIRKVGLSHIPEDRLATGVSRSASVTDNLLMGKQRDKAFSGFAFHQRRSSIERYAEEVYERFDIRGAGIDTAVGSMSGGNMQKVVVAREFSFDSPVLIIAQPTRGVDVGAIEFIHTRIIEKRNAGCAILLCSADLDEVFRLSDRIITMYEGRITGEFRTSDITKEEIGWYMTGHREGKEAAKA